MIKFLFILLLTGCALKSNHNPPLPIQRAERVAVHGYQFCTEAMTKIQVYMRHEGVSLMVLPEGEAVYNLYCIPVGPLILFSPIFGLASHTTSYVLVTGISTLDVQSILHELLHTFGISHSWTGVMFPALPFHWLATGASDEDMQAVRECKNFYHDD